MAGFKFRMEPLLKMRKLKQELSERELAKVLGELLHHQSQLENLERQLDLHYQQIRDQHLMGQIEIDAVIADRRYLNHLHSLRLNQQQMIGHISERVNQARSKLAQAKKQTDIMKKLKEHMYNKYMTEQNKQEIKQIDDLVNARIASKVQREKFLQ